MPELIALRTLNSKTYDIGGGQRTLEVSRDDIHYDDNGSLLDIDLSIVPSDRPGYDWMNLANDFKFHVKENLNQADSIVFVRQGVEIKARPKGVMLHRRDNGNTTLFQNPGNTTCQVVGNSLVFTGLYPDCEVTYASTPYGLKEFIEIDNLNWVPDPTDFGINPDVVAVAFALEMVPTGHDSTEDETGTPVGEDVDIDEIHFKAAAKTVFGIPRLKAWRKALGWGTQHEVRKQIKTFGGLPHLIYGMMYSNLAGQQFPFIVDAVFSKSVTANADDGQWTAAGGFGATGGAMSLGYSWNKVPAPGSGTNYNIFARFTNVTIPAGSTVTLATFSIKYVNVLQVGAGTASSRIYCNDVDNATAPTSYGTAVTKATTAASTVLSHGTGDKTVTITTAVKEVIDRTGWASGNALMVLGKNTQTPVSPGAGTQYATLEHASLAAPSISISYTEPSTGWTGTINGVTNPAAVNGVTDDNISAINGVS